MNMKTIIVIAASVFLLACQSSSSGRLQTSDVSLNSASLSTDSAGAMVVTANPHASKAGLDILKAGGSAVDAAIAIESVLSLVEPQSSGLAGGGFMMYFDNQSKTLTVYDGREIAPAGVSETMFLKEDGESIGFFNAKHSGLSTGVPGMVSMLQLAHDDHGELPWGGHFSAARKLAEEGFEVSPRLQNFISRMQKFIPAKIEDGPLDAYSYFYKDDQPLQVGAVLRNPDYVETLDRLAKDPRDFYEGEIAKQIVAQVGQAPRAGSLAMSDLAAYQARKQTALCMPYKDKQVCGPPPASSWVGMASMLGLYSAGPSSRPGGASNPANWALFAQAQQLAYADRDQYVADDTFVDVPLKGLIDPQYLAQRAKNISTEGANNSINAGDPWAFENREAARYGLDATNDMAGTTHFVVVDSKGNVVSLTASVESIFGNARMAGGMFLNNQLTDFSFKPVDDQGKAIANKVEPGKRPRSSMSPTIVLDQQGEFYMASGSPGGNSILAYTAKTVLGVMEWGLTAQQAVDLPNMVARGARVRIEKDRASPELIQAMRDYGFEVRESAGENSGLSVVIRHSDGRLEGGVDPRREGTIEILQKTLK